MRRPQQDIVHAEEPERRRHQNPAVRAVGSIEDRHNVARNLGQHDQSGDDERNEAKLQPARDTGEGAGPDGGERGPLHGDDRHEHENARQRRREEMRRDPAQRERRRVARGQKGAEGQ